MAENTLCTISASCINRSERLRCGQYGVVCRDSELPASIQYIAVFSRGDVEEGMAEAAHRVRNILNVNALGWNIYFLVHAYFC